MSVSGRAPPTQTCLDLKLFLLILTEENGQGQGVQTESARSGRLQGRLTEKRFGCDHIIMAKREESMPLLVPWKTCPSFTAVTGK